MSKHTTTLNEILNSELQHLGFNEFVNDGNLTYSDPSFQFMQKILYYDKDVHNIVTEKFFKGFSFKDETIDKNFKEAFILRFLDREIARQTVEAFSSQVLHVTISREDYIYTVFSADMERYLQQHVETDSNELSNQTQDETQNQKSKDTEHQTTKDTGHQTSKETGKETGREENSSVDEKEGSNTTENREAKSTLPQSEININVDNDVLTFADDNTISKNKHQFNESDSGASQRDTKSDSEKNGTSDDERNGTMDNERNGTVDNIRNQKQDSTTTNHGLTKTFLIDNIEKSFELRERIFVEFDKKCFLQIW